MEGEASVSWSPRPRLLSMVLTQPGAQAARPGLPGRQTFRRQEMDANRKGQNVPPLWALAVCSHRPPCHAAHWDWLHGSLVFGYR